MKKKQFYISNMNCDSCVSHISEAIKKLHGIKKISIDLINEKADVVFESDKITEKKIIKKIRKAGYTAVLLEDSNRKTIKEIIKSKKKADSLHQVPTAISKPQPQQITNNILYKLIYGAAMSLILILFNFFIELPNEDVLIFILSSLVLIFTAQEFFLRGIPSLIKLKPNADTLIILGILSVFLYSSYFVFYTEEIATHFMDLVIISTIVITGRYIKIILKEKDAKGSSFFVWGIIFIAFFTFTGWMIVKAKFNIALFQAIAVLLVACQSNSSFSLLIGLNKGQENGILFKNNINFKKMSKINVFCLNNTNEKLEKLLSLLNKRKIKTILITTESPNEKAEKIIELQKKNKFVAMIGNGIDNVQALNTANIGIILDANFYIESEIFISIKGDLLKILDAIDLSKASLKKVKQNIFLTFIYNSIAIPLAIFGVLNIISASLTMSSFSILLILNTLRLRNWKIKLS